MILNKVCTFDIKRYKKHRQADNAKPGTINRELSVISHLITKRLIGNGWIINLVTLVHIS
jgi:hypothetical protein